jgi:predicted dehydrogenase
MQPYHYAIVGAGWRTEFFLRINAALPERFSLAGVVVRRPERARELEAKFGVRTFPTPEALLEAVRPEFWVASVSYGAKFAVNRALIETGIPLLTETPPAAGLEEMEQLWETAQQHGARVQVAEQFHRQPLHAARLAAVRAGRIGTAHTACISLCHGYHATSLLRMFLGVTFEEARIVGMGWTDRVLDSGGRDGAPREPEVKDSPQQIALLDFGDGRHGVFDFSSVQYFSPLRAQRVCVRGEGGEIVDQTLSTLSAEGDPISLPFERKVAGPNGNLEGHHLKGIQLGEQWIYRNLTAPARVSDEEIAMADILEGMGEYVRGGPEVYPLALAMQDHYLGLLIRQACETGAPVISTRRAWAG